MPHSDFTFVSNAGAKARLFSPFSPLRFSAKGQERPMPTIVENLRNLVLAPPVLRERCHAVFLDAHRQFLGSAAIGMGRADALSLSMRDLFQRALSIEANSMVLAHSHPSGDCHPSENDIHSTKRIYEVANSLSIELIDHLIFTQGAVYSIRKGGLL